MLYLNPAVIVKTGVGENELYCRVGMILGRGKMLREESGDWNGTINERHYLYTGSWAFGANGAIGYNIPLNDHLAVWCELNAINFQWAPDHREMTLMTTDGVDMLSSQTTNEIHTDYLDEVSEELGVPEPAGKPKQLIKYRYPFGSIGMSVGIRYALGSAI